MDRHKKDILLAVIGELLLASFCLWGVHESFSKELYALGAGFGLLFPFTIWAAVHMGKELRIKTIPEARIHNG